jgi:hypothetical protein
VAAANNRHGVAKMVTSGMKKRKRNVAEITIMKIISVNNQRGCRVMLLPRALKKKKWRMAAVSRRNRRAAAASGNGVKMKEIMA